MVSFGFYNSINHDRLYDADEFSSVFDGILSDGVFRTIGARFLVLETGTPNTLTVGSGRAWFNHTWTYNDASITIDISAADITYTRTDAVVLEVDRKKRINRIYYVEGEASPTAPYPVLKKGTDGVWQYPLAWVNRPPLNDVVAASQITNMVGSASCPWANGLSTDEFSTLDSRKVNRSGDTMRGNLTIDRNDGTTATVGQSYLIAGNNKSMGAVGNSRGFLRLYCAVNSYFGQLRTVDTLTAPRNINIPDKDGTIALLQDVSESVRDLRLTVRGWLSDGSVTRVTSNDVGDVVTPVYLDEGRFRAGREYVPISGGTYSGNITIDRKNNAQSYLIIGNNSDGSFIGGVDSGTSDGILRLFGTGTDPNGSSGGSGGSGSIGGGSAGGSSGRLAFRTDIKSGIELTSNRVLSSPNASGTIQVTSSSSRRVKENIRDMEDEEAEKILDVGVVKFDYIESYATGKGQSGVIAEDVVDIIPEAVEISRIYDETAPVDPETNPVPSVDYRKFVPYLIKMVQMQQKKIDELQTRVSALEQKESV